MESSIDKSYPFFIDKQNSSFIELQNNKLTPSYFTSDLTNEISKTPSILHDIIAESQWSIPIASQISANSYTLPNLPKISSVCLSYEEIKIPTFDYIPPTPSPVKQSINPEGKNAFNDPENDSNSFSCLNNISSSTNLGLRRTIRVKTHPNKTRSLRKITRAVSKTHSSFPAKENHLNTIEEISNTIKSLNQKLINNEMISERIKKENQKMREKLNLIESKSSGIQSKPNCFRSCLII